MFRENNMKSSSASIKVFIVLLCITAFFYSMVGNGYILLALSLVPVVHKIISCFSKKVKLSASWLTFIFLAVLSTALSPVTEDSYKFIYLLVGYFLVKLILENESGWQPFFAKTVYIFTSIVIIATFLSVLAPDFMLSLAEKFYSGETLEVYLQLFHNEAYPGIYGQTAINSYFISIFIAFLVSNIFNNQKKTLSYVLLIFAIIALFLTKKRSFLVGNVLAAFILFWRNTLSDKNKIRKMLTLAVIVVIIYLIILYHPATQGLVEKMAALDNADDISNGRLASWEMTIEIWKTSPLLGVGTNALVNVYGLSSHNVYLQVLAEMGIFGACAYIFLLASTLKQSLHTYGQLLQEPAFTQKNKAIAGTSIYMQVLLIVYSFFGNPLYDIMFMLPYTLFVAAMESYNRTYLRRGEMYENRNPDVPQHP